MKYRKKIIICIITLLMTALLSGCSVNRTLTNETEIGNVISRAAINAGNYSEYFDIVETDGELQLQIKNDDKAYFFFEDSPKFKIRCDWKNAEYAENTLGYTPEYFEYLSRTYRQLYSAYTDEHDIQYTDINESSYKIVDAKISNEGIDFVLDDYAVVEASGYVYSISFPSQYTNITFKGIEGYARTSLGGNIKIRYNNCKYEIYEEGIVLRDGEQISKYELIRDLYGTEDEGENESVPDDVLKKEVIDVYVNKISLNTGNCGQYFEWKKISKSDDDFIYTLLLKDPVRYATILNLGDSAKMQYLYLYNDAEGTGGGGSGWFDFICRYDPYWGAVCSTVSIESITKHEIGGSLIPNTVHQIYDPSINSARGFVYEIDIPDDKWNETVEDVCGISPDTLGKHLEIYDAEYGCYIYIFENGYISYENSEVIIPNIQVGQELLRIAGYNLMEVIN